MVGEHVVVYNARDGVLHRAVPVTRTIKIIDTPPSLTPRATSAGWCEADAAKVTNSLVHAPCPSPPPSPPCET